MNFIAPGSEPAIREIPLSQLAPAPENVRKTPPDPQDDAALKASIAALGLLENLIVRPDEPDSDGAERFAVAAGGRRLKAMQALVEDGVLDAGHSVPCQVRAGDAETAELSLAENVMRIPMHPADQVTAFAELAAAGQTVSAIAARFSASERIVEQRLRLGNAAPELLDAYRADEIDLEVLKAFAVTADRERQMAVWEPVSGQDHRPSAWQVKRLLTEERVPGTSAIARFVGVESYEAAGGQVLRDLFADEHEHGVWFEDPVLLEKLAMEKLQAAANELATRWKWAVPMVEVAWDDTASYGRIEPQPGTPTGEERAEIQKLETRYDEINGFGEDEWTDAVVQEAEAIEGAVEGRAMWRRDDFGMAGCIATVGRDGALHIIAGLVKPEDMPKPDGTGGAATGAANGHGPVAKARVLDIARTVFGPAWASARSKYKKPALADAMEAAFTAGDPPTGVSAAMHARALAWIPPGFAAFDTGRTVEEGDAKDDAAEAAGPDPDGPAETPEPAEPVADSGSDPAEAAPAGNGHGTEAAPEPEPSEGAAANDGKVAAGTANPGPDADPGDAGETDSGSAAANGPDSIGAAGPVNGQDDDPDRSEIPEFLQRVQ